MVKKKRKGKQNKNLNLVFGNSETSAGWIKNKHDMKSKKK